MDTPDWINQRLRDLGGLVEGESAYRLVDATKARTHHGKFRYLNPHNGRVFRCWILERRQPPSFFGDRSEWEKTRYVYDDVHQEWVDQKGEYPPNDGYVMITPISNEGEFLPLTESVYQSIAKKIKADIEFAEMREIERNRIVQIKNAEEEAEKNYRLQKTQEATDEYYKTNWGRLNRQQGAAINLVPR